jgi:hypothetical protein
VDDQDFADGIYSLFTDQGLYAIRDVTSLPPSGAFVGEKVFNRTDGKLYQWTGSAFELVVAEPDTFIASDKIVANTITGGLLATSGIITNSAQINDAVITNAKIENGAITTAKIGDAQITSAKIGDLQVDNAKIANLTVGTEKITASAITTLGAASGSDTFNRDFQNIIGVSISALGSRTMLVTVSGNCFGTSDKLVSGRILRNGVVQVNFTAGQQSTFTSGGEGSFVNYVPFSYSFTAMIESVAGTNTMFLQLKVNSGSTALNMGSNAVITVTELKK